MSLLWQARFFTTVDHLRDLPRTAVPEIAFAGRSNAGKSTAINILCNQKKLAFASKTPGRTQHINYFSIGGAHVGQHRHDAVRADEIRALLVDLPGYGYAKTSKTMTDEWNRLIITYLRGRPSLRRVVLLVDSRRGIMESDEEVLTLLDQAAMSTLVTLTKIDELKPAELKTVVAATEAKAAKHTAAYPEIFVTSSREKRGLDPLKVNLLLLAEA